MKTFLPKVILEEQMSFVLARSILEGILIIQKTLYLANKHKKASMFMKLDIHKAYDMVDWRFLYKTLETFKFSHQ